ncbi:MAG: maleylpyruvate isomerase N-terminal domain-containing protein, partial [Acidimicrobiia bacterium]|nr:maleylpyruvate isomerase N-terminal domain-containing protein [Acidimicrobiia bacterium]
MTDFDHITKTQQQMLLEDLQTFDDSDWASVTVCDPWTPRQLVAHLTALNHQTRSNFFKGLLSNRFNFDAFLSADMQRFDTGTNDDILNAFQRTVTQWKRPPLPKIVPPTESMIHAD